MHKQPNDNLYVNKTFLFVDDEPAICAAVKRMAGMYGVDVQTANSSSAAISLLEYDASRYFLVLTDEIMPGLSGTDMLIMIQQRWPHIRRALISGVPDPEVLEKGYEQAKIFRYLSKPITDQLISQLVEDACEAFLSEKGSPDETVQDRLAILERAISEGLSKQSNRLLFTDFARSYLTKCQQLWQQAKLYKVDVRSMDSEAYSGYLMQRCRAAVSKIDKKMTSLEVREGTAFQLSASLRQFGIRGLSKVDRFVDGDEALFCTMLATLKDYYAILGLPIKSMVSARGEYIDISLGSRFTYNDIFNPLLANVEKGVELVCLQIEFFMLAHLLEVKTELLASETLKIRLLL